ncbi:hypothetical protein [Staphylococcus simulans]|uniref:hypothetical protein n=1 Tax=Staphylococcus simulans TaxID=1286 RepID=UPI003CFAF6A7
MKKFIVASSAVAMLLGFGGADFVQAEEIENTGVVSNSSHNQDKKKLVFNSFQKPK